MSSYFFEKSHLNIIVHIPARMFNLMTKHKIFLGIQIASALSSFAIAINSSDKDFGITSSASKTTTHSFDTWLKANARAGSEYPTRSK